MSYDYPVRRLRARYAVMAVRATRAWIATQTSDLAGRARLIADHRLNTDTAYMIAVLADRHKAPQPALWSTKALVSRLP